MIFVQYNKSYHEILSRRERKREINRDTRNREEIKGSARPAIKQPPELQQRQGPLLKFLSNFLLRAGGCANIVAGTCPLIRRIFRLVQFSFPPLPIFDRGLIPPNKRGRLSPPPPSNSIGNSLSLSLSRSLSNPRRNHRSLLLMNLHAAVPRS